MYQALYRKWRPKVFADVIGQEHVTRTLRRQVAEGRTSHAYLFTGTRGTGKTTCAKILARAVNCENPQDGDPCCACPACVGLENGSFLDVLELDAASNNGVDQVRALRDEAIYAPASVRMRVYIVDEVHMLSTAAFNALLKILEEPPEHLMFILATTELHKVPATILSRCQRYAFRRIQPRDVEARLKYVAEQERIDLTEDGAELLSRLADGALRDGLSLLDQCAAGGGRVDSAAVLETLGLAGRLQTAELCERILDRDAAAALSLLGQLYDGGKDAGAVLGELSGLVRDLLLLKTAPSGGAALLSGGFDTGTLERLGKSAGGSRLLYMASTLQKASADLYYSASRRTDAELCILRLCDETLSDGVEALAARVEKLETDLAVTISAAPVRVRAPEPPQKAETARKPDPVKEPGPLRKMEPVRQMEPAPPPMDEPPPWSDADAPPEGGGYGEPVWEPDPPIEAEAPVYTPEPAPVPETPAPAVPAAAPMAAAPAAQNWNWPDLAGRCKGQLPIFMRPFFANCTGVPEGDALVLYAPDSTTLWRVNNDRVRDLLIEESGAARILFKEGAPPETDPEANRRELIERFRQTGTVQITGGAEEA